MRVACVSGYVIGDVVLGEILTAAKSKDQVIAILDLILRIQAILYQHTVVVLVRGTCGNDSFAIDGIVDVEVADAEEIITRSPLADVLEVIPKQHSLFPICPGKTSQHSRIYRVE